MLLDCERDPGAFVGPELIRVLRKGDDVGDLAASSKTGCIREVGLLPLRISRCFYSSIMACSAMY